AHGSGKHALYLICYAVRALLGWAGRVSEGYQMWLREYRAVGVGHDSPFAGRWPARPLRASTPNAARLIPHGAHRGREDIHRRAAPRAESNRSKRQGEAVVILELHTSAVSLQPLRQFVPRSLRLDVLHA